MTTENISLTHEDVQDLAAPDGYLTFRQVLQRWKISGSDLHELIAVGELVPAVLLSLAERFPPGEFRGGMYVGDTVNSVQIDYGSDMNGTNPEKPDFYENRQEFEGLGYCHCPTREADGRRYSFMFYSESASPHHTRKWYYGPNDLLIRDAAEGERRFLFPEEAIWQAEQKLAALGTEAVTPLTPPAEQSRDLEPKENDMTEKSSSPTLGTSPTAGTSGFVHRINKNSRVRVLDIEIEEAIRRAGGIENMRLLWQTFELLADEEFGCLLAARTDKGVKYFDTDKHAHIAFKNFAARIRRRMKKQQ